MHPIMRDKLDELENELGDDKWRIVSGYRSFPQQFALYAKGRTEPGSIVTYAKPGFSYHNYGIAADYAYFEPGKNPWEDAPWQEFRRAVYKVGGFIWGGNFRKFKDMGHIHLDIGLSLDDLKYNMDVYGPERVNELIDVYYKSKKNDEVIKEASMSDTISKPWYLSKTFWLNFIVLVAAIVPTPIADFLKSNFDAAAPVWAVINIVLRAISKDKLAIK